MIPGHSPASSTGSSPLTATTSPARWFLEFARKTPSRPFYSAAPIPKSNYTLWVFASIDGSLQLVDGVSKQSLTGLGFGSDLAGVRSTCGSGWQVLATSNSDNAADAVRAFEFPDREPVPVSPVLDFAGPNHFVVDRQQFFNRSCSHTHSGFGAI
jgi:hypothetical protein